MKKYIYTFALVALFCATSCSKDDNQALVSARKVLIDSDIVEAFDDGQAIMMLLKSPDIQVMGITSVTGNTWSQEGIAYGIRQMEICGATDVPIIAGSQYPLRQDRLSTLKDEVRKAPGRDSFWMGAVEYDPVTDWRKAYVDRYGCQPLMTPRNEDAADFIIRTLKENPHEVTLLAIGPCTNIAKAIRKEPGIERLAKNIIYNGGSFYIEGNTTPYAEFNVLYDPEAMGVCMRADFPRQTFVSLDVCEKVPMVRKDYMDMMDTIKDAALKDVFQHCFHYQDFMDNPDAVSHIWDVINACIVLDESVITDYVDVAVDIQDNPNLPEYGRTFESAAHNGKTARIIKDVNKQRVWQMIFNSLRE